MVQLCPHHDRNQLRRQPALVGVRAAPEWPCWTARGQQGLLGVEWWWCRPVSNVCLLPTSGRQLAVIPQTPGQLQYPEGTCWGVLQGICSVSALCPGPHVQGVEWADCPLFSACFKPSEDQKGTQIISTRPTVSNYVCLERDFTHDSAARMTLPAVLSNMWEQALKSPSVKVAACVNLLTPPCHSRTIVRMAISSGQHAFIEHARTFGFNQERYLLYTIQLCNNNLYRTNLPAVKGIWERGDKADMSLLKDTIF